MDGLSVALAVRAAAEARFHRREDATELVELLVTGPPVVNESRMIARQLLELAEHCVRRLAGAQWSPDELTRIARRRAGAGGEALVAAAIQSLWRSEGGRHDAARDPAWPGEVAAMASAGVGAWRPDPASPSWRRDVEAGVAALGVLLHLPALTERRTPRGLDRSAIGDARILEKVRALLSKAESTTFSEEADALTAKAQELLTRYSIDSAALHIGTRTQAQAAVRRLWIDDPYVGAKAHLLHVVCQANRCRSVLTDALGVATLVGHDDDLDTVEILFTSLLVQATTQMTAAGRKEDPFGRSRTRAFRQSFLVAFAARIGQRLEAVQERAVAEAAAAHGDALLPVLASRSSAADETVDEIFPTLVGRRTAATDYEGWVAGTAAADLANLTYQPELSAMLA